eukprot:Pgem_evm1s10608
MEVKYDHYHIPTLQYFGVGEVCTEGSHQRKGLASKLLDYAISMQGKQNQNCHLAILHSSSVPARRVYRKCGFVSLP